MINPILTSLKAEIETLKKGKLCKPRMAVVTPTYDCNQNCYYCFFKTKINGDMIETDEFLKIIKQIANFGIQSIEYCGGGESLLLPRIEQIFKYAHSLGLRQGLLTNGVLFIRVKSAVWRSELIFMKYKILHKMEKELGRNVVNDIRFFG